MDENPAIAGFVKWFETLGKTGVHRLSQFCAKDVRCRTPELDAMGRDGAAAVYARIFEGVSSVKIRVFDIAPGLNGHNTYLRWDRLVTPERGANWTLSGVTELTLGMDGKIVSIVEYWDGTPPDHRGIIAKLLNR